MSSGALVVRPGLRTVLEHLWWIRHFSGQHQYGHLREVASPDLRGKTLLSDPWTSYFARYVLGTYAVVVPAYHSSPTVDADVREAITRAVLTGGPQTAAQLGISVGAVIIDKGSTNSAPFYASMGRGRGAIVRHWESSGWRVAQDTPHLWLLIPRRGKPSTQASWASPTSRPP
jgi:hypothetical protein